MTEALLQNPAVPTTIPVSEEQPKEEQRYKCYTCHTIIKESQLMAETKNCPQCGETFKHLVKMCRLDHCNCTHTDPIAKITYCPECGEPVCPLCGTHDILIISRVTGYLQDLKGWNSGKQAEFKDRHRYNMT